MTEERTGVSEGASVQASPAPAAAAEHDAPLHPSDSPTQGIFSLERAREVIQQLSAEHDAAQSAEHRAPTAIELGKQQVAGIETELLALTGRDTGPLQQLHGLQVIPVNEDDHVALVYSGVAGA